MTTQAVQFIRELSFSYKVCLQPCVRHTEFHKTDRHRTWWFEVSIDTFQKAMIRDAAMEAFLLTATFLYTFDVWFWNNSFFKLTGANVCQLGLVLNCGDMQKGSWWPLNLTARGSSTRRKRNQWREPQPLLQLQPYQVEVREDSGTDSGMAELTAGMVSD